MTASHGTLAHVDEVMRGDGLRGGELPFPVPSVDHAGPVAARRSLARSAAVSALWGSGRGGRESMVALRAYGEGCLAVALRGSFGGAALAGLRLLRPRLAELASVELTLDLAALEAPARPLVRLLAQLRMQQLVAGARVELHDPPRELVAAVGDAAVDHIAVLVGGDDGDDGARGRHRG